MPSFSTKALWLLLWAVLPCIAFAQTRSSPQCLFDQFIGTVTNSFVDDCTQSFTGGPIWFLWKVEDSDDDEYEVKVKAGDSVLYASSERFSASTGSTELTTKGVSLDISYTCTNEKANCIDVTFSYRVIDCGCPEDLPQLVTSCEQGSVSNAKSAVCMDPTDPPSPAPAAAPATAPPTEIRSSGFWQLSGSGNVVEGNSASFSFSHGVQNAQEITDTTEVSKEVSRTAEIGAYIETSLTLGFTTGVEAGFAGTGVSMEFSAEFGLTVGASASLALSETASQSVGQSVSRSVEVFSEKGCTQTCTKVDESPTAFLWRWVQVIYDLSNEQTVGVVDTCEYWCLYRQGDKPLCPPGFCANPSCTQCIQDTFEDKGIDAKASATDAAPDIPTDAPIIQGGGSTDAQDTSASSSSCQHSRRFGVAAVLFVLGSWQ